MCPTASFLGTGGFKFYYFKMHAWSTSVVAAFQIYAQRGEDAAKRRPCIKK